MNLFEINHEIRCLVDNCVDAETGEISPDIAEEIKELAIDKERKIEYLALLKKECEYESEALADEIKILQARKKTIENKCVWIKSYLSSVLNGEKFETPRVSISWRKSEILHIDNENLLPPKYYKYTESVDKIKIKDDLIKGEEILGCKIITKNNIQIK